MDTVTVANKTSQLLTTYLNGEDGSQTAIKLAPREVRQRVVRTALTKHLRALEARGLVRITPEA